MLKRELASELTQTKAYTINVMVPPVHCLTSKDYCLIPVREKRGHSPGATLAAAPFLRSSTLSKRPWLQVEDIFPHLVRMVQVNFTVKHTRLRHGMKI